MKSIMVVLLVCLMSVMAIANEKKTSDPVSIGNITAGMQKHEGFVTYYWDESKGAIWLELTITDKEFLYVNSLPHGVGSNQLGLDRGQLDNTRIVFFRRVGPKVLLIQPNYSFRAITDNLQEQKAVDESFAISTLHSFEVVAESDGRVLVDGTSFFLRDARGVASALKRAAQGSFKLDLTRSVLDTRGMRSFPDNTEVSALLTFVSDTAGELLSRVAPTPTEITIMQRHSFIRLPDDKYAPRVFDPRAGYFGISYMDFATPIGEPITKRFITRHRLQKKDPTSEISEAVRPIVYYVDRGAPEPIRSALVDGASWWDEAFKTAGYKNAFQVRLLPDSADPMDVRYNVIQWVHRSSRGWSYGDAVIDPRTGEIIKGHVSLGSLRARQDYLIAEGILGPYSDSGENSQAMLELSLARLRQLSAHEVGHTLGLRHNFAASTNNRASVMDYPYPLVEIDESGEIDLSNAYGVGLGAWDLATIGYGYRDLSRSSDEQAALSKYLDNIYSGNMSYLSDADARSYGSAHPKAHLWDNGSNPVDELNRVMNVRRVLLDRFSEKTLAFGRPMALIEETLVPIFMFHRYQLAAAAKVIGGLDYDYALRDGRAHTVDPVDPSEQRRAVEALLNTLKPEALSLSEPLIRMIQPHTTGYRRERENFSRRTGPAFDPLSAAESAADLTVGLMLHPHRAARLVEHHARDEKLPGLVEVIALMIAATWQQERSDDYPGELRRVVDNVVLYHLFELAADRGASNQVRAIANTTLDDLSGWLEKAGRKTESIEQRSHLKYARSQIMLFQKSPAEFQASNPSNPPAGSPIGADSPEGYGCGWR